MKMNGAMKRIVGSSVVLLCLLTLGIRCPGTSEAQQASSVTAEGRLENRDQLLAAVNAWMTEHHQAEWSMDELVGRLFEQAYGTFLIYDDSPLDPPVESFLVSLVKNQPFTQSIRLRTDWRTEIELHMAEGEMIRQRMEWAKVLKKPGPRREVEEKRSAVPRRLALPPHYTLSLDIIPTPAEARNKEANPKGLTHWGIYLETVLAKQKEGETSKVHHDGPESVATPGELLSAINTWRHDLRQPAITLDQLTARVADEAFAIGDARRDLWGYVELFLECLAKDAPFVYPMRLAVSDPAARAESGERRMLSINEEVQVPACYKASIEVLDLPWDASTEENPLRIDWTTIIVSYVFPARKTGTNPQKTH